MEGAGRGLLDAAVAEVDALGRDAIGGGCYRHAEGRGGAVLIIHSYFILNDFKSLIK